ncbi:PCRF domain-containing protein, partial [Pseudomonas aeruginosa]|nr:PCRF domain-containing protein [Pseudomonas aeruginosa]
ELEQPDVWNEPERAQALGKERSSLEAIVDTLDQMSQGLEDVAGLLDLAVEADDEETFNEAFMMHTSTSPSYPIVASIETAAAMLRGNSGKRLIQRSIERALDFRKEVQRLREESDGWFFDIWQPEAVDKAECWPVAPG